MLEHTNVEEVDTDGDGYPDGRERYMHTDPTRFDLAESSYNWFENNGVYCSSLISEAFVDGSWLTIQLYLGNGLFNFNLDFVRNYKIALLQYISTYSEAILQNDVLEVMKEQYEDNRREATATVLDGAVRLLAIEGESSEYYKALNKIKELGAELDDLTMRQLNIDSYADLYGFDDALLRRYNEITVQMTIVTTEMSDASKTIDNTNVIKGMTEKVGKVFGNVPSEVNELFKLLDKGGEIMGYAGIAIETGGDVYDTLQLYSSLSVEAEQYTRILEMLDAIVEESENSQMRFAAQEVRLILEEDIYAFVNEAGDIVDELRQGASKTAVTVALAKMGVFAFAIDLGLAFGDFIANTGEMNEKSLKTVALGDAASAYAKYVKKQLENDVEGFYFLSDTNCSQIQFLGQLRICGEDSFCEVSDSRGFVMKLIDWFRNGSQEEIKADCRDRLQNVIDVCDTIGVYVTMDYEGAYLK